MKAKEVTLLNSIYRYMHPYLTKHFSKYINGIVSCLEYRSISSDFNRVDLELGLNRGLKIFLR